MSRSWWPFRRRSDKSKEPRVNGAGDDRRLDETRRIARHVVRQALQAGKQEQEPEPEPEPDPPKKGVTITVYGEITHVNFHQTSRIFENTFLRKDPITRRQRRVARRFDRSDAFYTKDGRLIDDSTRPGQG